MSATECRRCIERGKTWSGSDPKCAFRNGFFVTDNWNCATMNKLREIADEIKTTQRDDNSCGSVGYIPMDNDYIEDEDFDTYGGYIVMMWYKNKGKTGNAVFMTDELTTALTVKHAELAIKTHDIWYKANANR